MRRRQFTTEGGYTARELLVYARDHMASARVLFERSWECHDSAGYLSHLGLELLLKALLLHRQGAFPDSHNLETLLELIQQQDAAFILEEADRLTLNEVSRFGASRYPDPHGAVEVGDEDWPRLSGLWQAISARLPPELRVHLRTKLIPTPEHLKQFTDAKTVIAKGNRVLFLKRIVAED